MRTERSSTTPAAPKGTGIRSFGSQLEPRYIIGTEPLDQ